MPTTRTTETTVYTFDELSERAKETARDWYRQSSAQDFSDYQAENVIEDAARMGDIIGIDIRSKSVRLMGGGTRLEPEVYYSGFSSQGDGASFVGRYEYRKGSCVKLSQEAPPKWTHADGTISENKGNAEINRIARELAEIQRRNFYRIVAHVSCGRSNYAHSGTMQIDVERSDDNDLLSADDAKLVHELMRDFADWIYRSLEREYDYQMSDECVDESILANDYEFDESGHRI